MDWMMRGIREIFSFFKGGGVKSAADPSTSFLVYYLVDWSINGKLCVC